MSGLTLAFCSGLGLKFNLGFQFWTLIQFGASVLSLILAFSSGLNLRLIFGA